MSHSRIFYIEKHVNSQKIFVIKDIPKIVQKMRAKKLVKLSPVDLPTYLFEIIFFQDFVVRYMDYFEGEQQSVILTEYLGGGELFEHISSSSYELTESKCRDFARQVTNRKS